MLSLRSIKSSQIEGGDWVFAIELDPIAIDKPIMEDFSSGTIVGCTLSIDGREVRVNRISHVTGATSHRHRFHIQATPLMLKTGDFADERSRLSSEICGIKGPWEMETVYTLSSAGWHGRQMNAFEDGWDAAVEFFIKKGLLKLEIDFEDRKQGRERRLARESGKTKFKIIEVKDDSI